MLEWPDYPKVDGYFDWKASQLSKVSKQNSTGARVLLAAKGVLEGRTEVIMSTYHLLTIVSANQQAGATCARCKPLGAG